MTTAFKQWVDEVSVGKFPGSYNNARFWIAAFVQELKQEGQKGIYDYPEGFETAFENKVRDFGLGGYDRKDD